MIIIIIGRAKEKPSKLLGYVCHKIKSFKIFIASAGGKALSVTTNSLNCLGNCSVVRLYVRYRGSDTKCICLPSWEQRNKNGNFSLLLWKLTSTRFGKILTCIGYSTLSAFSIAVTCLQSIFANFIFKTPFFYISIETCAS